MTLEYEITLKNVRCFPDSCPITFRLGSFFTAFVGANNTGKTALLRFFYEIRKPLVTGGIINMIAADVHHDFEHVLDQEEVFHDENDRPLKLEVKIHGVERGEQDAETFVDGLEIVVDRRRRWRARLLVSGRPFEVPDDSVRQKWSIIGRISKKPLVNLDAVRGFHEDLAGSMYVGPFRHVVGDGGGAYYDLVTGTAFVNNWNQLKTGNSRQDNQLISEVTEDIRSIFGFDRLDISASADRKTLHVNVDGRPYKLHEMGAGISEFILVFGLAAIKKPSFLLIDEPELHLHPSLQVDFVTRLAKYAKRGLVFATHSIGLARSTSEQIYSIVRDHRSSCPRVYPLAKTKNYSQFLGEMGFSGYQALGWDQVLLVEGTTDVKFAQQVLRLYKQDHSVLVLPLGGAAMINASVEHELVEVKRLTENIAVLIDSERMAPTAALDPAREGFAKLCHKHGIQICVTERRATENYLADAAVKKEKGSKYRALSPYEPLEGMSPCWGKAENWVIASRMTRADFDGTDIGEFFRALAQSKRGRSS